MYGINGFSGGLGGFGARASTDADALPAFCGVNAGLPWAVCTNGFEISLRSDEPDAPVARKRSVWCDLNFFFTLFQQ